MIFVLVFAALAATAPAPVLRYACDRTTSTLHLDVDGVGIVIGADDNVTFAPQALAQSDVPLSSGRAQPAILTDGPDGLRTNGSDLRQCAADGNKCKSLTRLPVEVRAAISGAEGWLLAGGRPTPGLYRAARAHPEQPGLIAPGDVRSLCAVGDGEAWVVLGNEQNPELAFAATSAPTVRRYALAELLARAVAGGTGDADAVDRALSLAINRGLPDVRLVAHVAVTDTRQKVRARAAALLFASGPDVGPDLWMLAHDTVNDVRKATLDVVITACNDKTWRACADQLVVFVNDADPEISWTARDHLLERVPRLALNGAPREYKLDAISLLSVRMRRNGVASVREALDVLIGDSDAEVRQAARALSGNFEP